MLTEIDINNSLKEADLPEAIFKTEGMFTIVFKKRLIKSILKKTSEKTSEKILSLLKENSNITISQMAEVIGVSSRSIERNVKKLKSERKLKRIGPDKGGYWEVLDK
ncbi:MAG: hypothetical protein B6I18_04595 [Bacteroidetes bacterium 4572_112]|nr:MAG: hypothetical protein B6I18_04595 [Bacteroidetes bacterium 4572_112]